MEENATYPEFIPFTSAMPPVPEDEFCVYGIVSESALLYSTPHSPLTLNHPNSLPLNHPTTINDSNNRSTPTPTNPTR